MTTTTERPVITAAPRNWKTAIVLSVLAAITVLFFGILGSAEQSRFVWSDAADVIVLPSMPVQARALGLVAGILLLILSAWSFLLARRRASTPLWLMIIAGLLFMASLLANVGAGHNVPVVFLLTGTIALSTAVIFGSLAGVIGERVGVVNIAIEGQLLAGAFVSAVAASITGSLAVGLFAAMIGGALVSMVLAAFSMKYFVDQIVVGVVLNGLVIGLTNFFYSALLSGNSREWNFPGTLPRLAIPGLSNIPVIGPVFFDQRITTYVMFVLVPLVWFVLFKTRWGLRIRALGEHPLAADSVGINVNRTRFWTVTLAGMIAGFGGAALTLGSVGAFVREMSAGQGFIALACVILGRWNPWMAAMAALLFGFSRNFRIWAGQVGSPIPPDLIAMTPYLVTLIAVAVLVGKAVGPAAAGKAYSKE
ncbi:MAG: ABC transporter permease [Microbacteriaceae bacterium]